MSLAIYYNQDKLFIREPFYDGGDYLITIEENKLKKGKNPLQSNTKQAFEKASKAMRKQGERGTTDYFEEKKCRINGMKAREFTIYSSPGENRVDHHLVIDSSFSRKLILGLVAKNSCTGADLERKEVDHIPHLFIKLT